MPRPRRSVAGTRFPGPLSRLLRSGAEIGDAADCPDQQQFPGLSRKVVARPCGGLRLFRVLGSAAPWSARRNRHRVSVRACNTASRRSKGQVSHVPGRVAVRLHGRRGLARPETTVSWLPMPQNPTRLQFCYDAYRRVLRRRATASGSPNCSRAIAVQKAPRAGLIAGGSHACFRRFAGQRP